MKISLSLVLFFGLNKASMAQVKSVPTGPSLGVQVQAGTQVGSGNSLSPASSVPLVGGVPTNLVPNVVPALSPTVPAAIAGQSPVAIEAVQAARSATVPETAIGSLKEGAAQIGKAAAGDDSARISRASSRLFGEGSPRAGAASAVQEESLLVDRVGDLAFVQIKVDGFDQLPKRQKVLAYHLSKAAMAGWDITFDQLHRHGLAIRRQLDEILAHPQGIDPAVMDKIKRYALRVYAMRGIYDDTTQKKFLPEFTRDEWAAAVVQAKDNHDGGWIHVGELRQVLEIGPTMFDPSVDPMMRDTTEGVDKIKSSGVNFYEGLTEAEVASYARPKTLLGRAKAWAKWLAGGFREREWPYARYPENSRLVKSGGKIREQVHRAGDPKRGIKPGLYAKEYSNIIAHLENALPYAGPPQAKALRHLIAYFKTGNPKDFLRYNIAWVKDNARVDAVIGPIEVYDDPDEQKATYQGLVNMIDPRMEDLRAKIAAVGPYLEVNAPWDKKYKKDKFTPPNIRFVQDLMRTGAMGGASHTVGENLPNDKRVVEKHGSKSTIMRNIIPSLDAAAQGKSLREFSYDPVRDEALNARWGDVAETLMIGLHEGAGHALGRVNPKLKGLPPEHLKQYYSALEEARAELAALWFIADPELQGKLVPSPEAAEWAYREFMTMQGLAKMFRLPRGTRRWEGAHDKARSLIVGYLLGFKAEEIAALEKAGVRGLTSVSGALELREKDGKIYLEVVDLKKARAAVGQLMAEVMRVIGEGNFAAAKALVEGHAIPVRPEWLAQVKDRYDALGLHQYSVEIQPEMVLIKDAAGEEDVEIRLPRDYVGQMLRFGSRVP